MSIVDAFPPISAAPDAECCECGIRTNAPVVVRHIEQSSGPGVTLYACPPCAPTLTPGPHPDDVVRTPRK
ncbi:hypothetical protein [Streptomyces nondiastaticus]|uniref:Small CPxCG-related zinc finger protein n=1 Tax=Streptomyces nondiastaticus TaxID=3154512 RepID=A0ABW6U782_9ACTN